MSKTIVNEDVTRLPQWAQRLISLLEHNNKDLKKQISELSGNEPSDIQWSSDYSSWHNIPMYSTIRIRLANGHQIEILKDSNGNTRLSSQKVLILKPWSANSVHIESEDW